MAITIHDYMLPGETHNLYDVNFFGDIIHTLLTQDPTVVSQWLSEIQSLNHSQDHHLIIGLDVEWRPKFNQNIENPVAMLQLCVERRCLIYQLIHSPSIPPSLVDFLSNQKCTFVGIGITADLEKLEEDCGFGFNAKFKNARSGYLSDEGVEEFGAEKSGESCAWERGGQAERSDHEYAGLPIAEA
ncbi:unnamed protein product [Fraxinus pennsylvanica]|uniref:Werner Syndrome-like exonuclease n=1 Tax=Fraxinus pennsylvanica TaxID=56036 RepID=A0AAD1ZNM9_9LAMI|nr:unnamed protein product [Fraxinus pennsylvanica]